MHGHVAVEVVLASAVADAGTFTAGYPSGYDSGFFADFAGDHYIQSHEYGKMKSNTSFAFGANEATITNNSGVTLAAGTTVWVNFDITGTGQPVVSEANNVADLDLVRVLLGAPDAADPDGVMTAFTGAAGALTLNGALVTDGVATFDVPRNVVIDSGGADTAVLTITGTDQFGATMVENITLNGTTAVAGLKAFKTVTSIVSSAAIANGAFVGTGDVLGLPFAVYDSGSLLGEHEDGAAATAGTLVAAAVATPTATTGDVRGTYDPNSAMDGSTRISLLIATGDKSDKGLAQFAG